MVIDDETIDDLMIDRIFGSKFAAIIRRLRYDYAAMPANSPASDTRSHLNADPLSRLHYLNDVRQSKD